MESQRRVVLESGWPRLHIQSVPAVYEVCDVGDSSGVFIAIACPFSIIKESNWWKAVTAECGEGEFDNIDDSESNQSELYAMILTKQGCKANDDLQISESMTYNLTVNPRFKTKSKIDIFPRLCMRITNLIMRKDSRAAWVYLTPVDGSDGDGFSE